jgi:hypothetical protein
MSFNTLWIPRMQGAQLEILQDILYPEEEEEYRSLEEQYFAEELAKIYLVKCEEWGSQTTLIVSRTSFRKLIRKAKDASFGV